MRIYLFILVFVVFLLIGVFIYCKYYFRYQLYKDLTFVCKYVKNNISFRKDKVNILLNDACSGISYFSKHLILNTNINILIIYKKQDIDNVNKFVKSIGVGDIDYELNNLQYYENVFDDTRVVARDLLNKNGIMYIKLMIGIGLAIGIMLI